MKSSGVTTVIEPSPSTSRRQPVRQTRTNPSRNALNSSGPFGGRGSLGRSLEDSGDTTSAPGFFPAITHFTDSIDALPKEMIRNYTMLKEVDAKIYGPEDALKQMVSVALKAPAPVRKDRTSQRDSDGQSYSGTGTNLSVSGSVIGTNVLAGASQESTNSHEDPVNFDLADLPRRKLFFQLRMIAGEMLATLDEKNHVLAVAAETLDKQLARCESSYPYVSNEISEESRYGNIHHWAYLDKTTEKKGTTANERTRREAATTSGLAAALTQEGELAAMRSEARREALAAKKRAPPGDSDFDDNRTVKKLNTAKGKKMADTSSTSTTVGLGITNGATTTGLTVSHKRRKVEKTVVAGGVEGLAMERSLSAVYGPTAVTSRGGAGSPRDTPAVEASKKRARAGTITNGNGVGNRRQRFGTTHHQSFKANQIST